MERRLVDSLRMRLGGRLRDLRQARRLTQEQLAEQAGLSYKFIGEIERGQGNPTVDTLQALGSALSVDVSDLFGSHEGRRQPPSSYSISQKPLLRVREALQSLEQALQQMEAAYPPRLRRRRKP